VGDGVAQHQNFSLFAAFFRCSFFGDDPADKVSAGGGSGGNGDLLFQSERSFFGFFCLFDGFLLYLMRIILNERK
jgi:hypothetical protein